MASAAFHFDAQASLLKVSVSSGGTTTATLDSTTGVHSCEWSIIAVDDSTSIGDWSLSASTGNSTVVTAPSGRGIAARLQCKINGGSVLDPRTGQLVTGDYIKTAKIYVTPEVITLGETNESDSSEYYLALVNNAIRSLSASGTLYSTSDVFTLTGPGTTIGVTTSAEALTVQPGQSSSGAGKSMTWGGGAGQTPGTHAAGDSKCELGQTVSGATAEMQWLSNGTRVGGVKVDTASRLYLSNASSISSTGLYIEASTGYVAIKGASSTSIESTTDNTLYCTSNYGFTRSWQSASGASTIREVYATSTTTNATPANIGSLPITNDRVTHVKAVVTCYKDNATVRTFEVVAAFRAAGGTATRAGASTTLYADGDAGIAAATVALGASGANAVATCTGIAATTLRWEVYLTGHVGKG